MLVRAHSTGRSAHSLLPLAVLGDAWASRVLGSSSSPEPPAPVHVFEMPLLRSGVGGQARPHRAAAQELWPVEKTAPTVEKERKDGLPL